MMCRTNKTDRSVFHRQRERIRLLVCGRLIPSRIWLITNLMALNHRKMLQCQGQVTMARSNKSYSVKLKLQCQGQIKATVSRSSYNVKVKVEYQGQVTMYKVKVEYQGQGRISRSNHRVKVLHCYNSRGDGKTLKIEYPAPKFLLGQKRFAQKEHRPSIFQNSLYTQWQ